MKALENENEALLDVAREGFLDGSDSQSEGSQESRHSDYISIEQLDKMDTA